jgi:CubicO group peptidase (beta-lactamase class C family)
MLFAVAASTASAQCRDSAAARQPGSIVPLDTTLLRVRSRVLELISTGQAPSMAVAVATNGNVAWEEGFGCADVENGVAATPQTIYRVGSVSKSIIATGLMTLVDRGKVSLDDRVDKLIAPTSLTFFDGDASALRVKHLLNMTAGIGHGALAYYDHSDAMRMASQRDAYIKHVPIAVFPPGEVYEYSNFSMWIPELIIEKVSGKSFDRFMAEDVFTPLGMTSTMSALDPSQRPRAAIGYSTPNERLTRPAADLIPAGGLGYYSTAHDLVRYGMFHLNTTPADHRPVLTSRTLDLMHNYDQGPQGRLFALGWFNVGDRLISDGQVGGANSVVMLVPSKKVAIAVLMNMTSRGATALAYQVAAEIAEAMGAEAAAPGAHPPVRRGAEFAGSWTGAVRAYGGDVPITMVVGDTGDVRIRLGASAMVPLDGVRFNARHELRGSFSGPVRTFESRDAAVESSLTITVRRTSAGLSGYVGASFSNAIGSFSIPLYVRLEASK